MKLELLSVDTTLNTPQCCNYTPGVLELKRTSTVKHFTNKQNPPMKTPAGAYTSPGEVVLYSFADSDFTGDTATALDRLLMGIEKNHKLFDLSVKMLREEENTLKIG